MDEFFCVSACTTAKQIWDTLVETREGTVEVKRSRLNTLSQEYELFRMQPRESILELQKRFVHLINHLDALGKKISIEEQNLKVLRSLTREWQPKVTAISKKKTLTKMTSATLFGKLQEYETKLERIQKHESLDSKSKGISLKVNSMYDDPSVEDENFMLLVKRLGKCFGKNNKSSHVKRKNHFRKKEASTSTQDVTCCECGKQGHIKPDCPKLSKNGGVKGKKDLENKKAYVAWEDNEISSSSDSDSDESANLTLMASHHSYDENDEVSNEFSIFDNDAQGAINELLNECKMLYRTISTQEKQIKILEKMDTMQKDFEVEKKQYVDKIEQKFTLQKNDAFEAFKKYAKQIQNEKSLTIASIRSDHGGEFQNASFEEFCEEHGISHNFSAPRTPQQNGVVERKNRSLVELARAKLSDSKLPKYFWADAISTACFVSNRVNIRHILKKTPYELFKGRKPNIANFTSLDANILS
ncbi:uncharacterized protein LOC131604975 [Vicia villosa]|uniref:uncharacterized protein LOC131604975 n=1 Tax=Vicia villosa TaxID=3911 RepID=UPI00273BBFC9|nr:uncharacterized protein LOC131604975 [Vicia villosa]